MCAEVEATARGKGETQGTNSMYKHRGNERKKALRITFQCTVLRFDGDGYGTASLVNGRGAKSSRYSPYCRCYHCWSAFMPIAVVCSSCCNRQNATKTREICLPVMRRVDDHSSWLAICFALHRIHKIKHSTRQHIHMFRPLSVRFVPSCPFHTYINLFKGNSS